MNFTTILDFVNLFFAGTLAGIEIVIHYGFRGTDEALDEKSQLLLRQALVVRLRTLVPAFFVPTAVTGIAVTVLNGAAPGFLFRGAGVLAVLAWIWTRVVGTVSINSDTVDWKPDVPPKDWKAQVNHAERFHVIGTWAAITAFMFFLTALALKLADH